MQKICYTHQPAGELPALIAELAPDRLCVLTDENTARHCLPLMQAACEGATQIVIGATDANKTLNTLSDVWSGLQKAGATRHSLLVNLGGGMVTDLGGFAAATYKRGIRFINIPTTLLSMVDAAVGGKTGINFGGFKNEVGAFCDAQAVMVSTRFLCTLDADNVRSGYAEMLKHALLQDVETWADHLRFDLERPDLARLQQMVRQNIDIKQRIVASDPRENGPRKALNLGHTVGHAIESYLLATKRPVLHGVAVAWGLACELYISACQAGFPTERMRQTVRFIRDNYGTPPLTCDDYPRLHELMRHDKKNTAGRVCFVLLADVGNILLDRQVPWPLVDEAFDFLREG